jgi:uncharacterized membrane protein YgdD (TMEM256/DUF423 family)
MKPAAWIRVAAVLGFLGVALGAFGAHGLKNVLAANNTADIWKTASFYHLIHAAVLLVVARLDPLPRAVAWLFTSGVVIFSGSLYALAVTNIKWLGAITPAGGVAFLAGWLLLALHKGTGSARD